MPKFRADMGRVEDAREDVVRFSGLGENERLAYYRNIIMTQGEKIRGLRLQMQQMARGYQRALRRIEQQYKADKMPRTMSNRLRRRPNGAEVTPI